MKLAIHIDGGARGNPGPAAAGVVIHDAQTSKPVHEAGYFLGSMTNNMAEYQGLLLAIELAVKMNPTDVHISSDSQLMVRQILGEYRVKSPTLKPLYEQACRLLKGLKKWRIVHVMREKNKRADALANLAMDARGDVIVVAIANTPTDEIEPEDVRSPGKATDDAAPPHWTVRLTTVPDNRCPANQSANRAYAFGPTAPGGFCIYAAKIVLNCLLNGDSAMLRTDATRTAQCARCEASIQIKADG